VRTRRFEGLEGNWCTNKSHRRAVLPLSTVDVDAGSAFERAVIEYSCPW
jgi:hypothetical protein